MQALSEKNKKMYPEANSVHEQRRSIIHLLQSVITTFLPLMLLVILTGGCVSERVDNGSFIPLYQETMAVRGPQERSGKEGLEPILPLPDTRQPERKDIEDRSLKRTIHLPLENAVLRALANSPEITVVSFDPSIAKENIAVAASEFDVTTFGQVEYDKNDTLSNDVSQSDQFHSSMWEAGIKQKGITGAEWSLAYVRTRSSDESVTRKFPVSYEPVMTFELKQPLLRDAWPDTNLADVNISKLNYRAALAAFRKKSEEVSTQVISLYWTLLQARRDVEIQEELLKKTSETLKKVEDRKSIDATVGDIKQAEASVKSREAVLYEYQKRLSDVQDSLVRLLATNQINLVDNLEIIPSTPPDRTASDLDQSELLQLALKNNAEIQHAKLEAEAAEIGVRVAKKQRMPRLDIVASAQMQGLSDGEGEANEVFSSGDYTQYTLGVLLEYPLGNREKKAAYRLKKLKHAKALSHVNNISDQVATLVKERVRFAKTAYREIQIQKDAVNAAEIHLQSLDDIEKVRKKLTPEFLLAKIQGQDSLANAKRAEIKAIVDYNIALARLAQSTGTALDLRSVQSVLTVVKEGDQPVETAGDAGQESEEQMPPAQLHESSENRVNLPALGEDVLKKYYPGINRNENRMEEKTTPAAPLFSSIDSVKFPPYRAELLDKYYSEYYKNGQ